MLYILLAHAKKKGCPEAWVNNYWFNFKDWEYEGKKVKLVNEDRRWEIISGMQKACRRGDHVMATRLASAMCSTGNNEVLLHLWKRITVTAMEDIGFGNEPLIGFSLICFDVMTKAAMLHQSADLAMFLVHCLASTHVKDRTICDLGVIDEILSEASIPQIHRLLNCGPEAQRFIEMCNDKKYYESDSDSDNWLKTQGAKTAGLAAVFIPAKSLVDWGSAGQESGGEEPAFEMIKGCPSYAYDMYTRSGKRAIKNFVQDPSLQGILKQWAPGVDHEALVGTIIFDIESGWLNNWLMFPERPLLYTACIEIAMASLGVEYENYHLLVGAVKAAMPVLNKYRVKATQSY